MFSLIVPTPALSSGVTPSPAATPAQPAVPKARGRGRGATKDTNSAQSPRSETNNPQSNTPRSNASSPRPSVESPHPSVESPRPNVESPSQNANVKPSR